MWFFGNKKKDNHISAFDNSEAADLFILREKYNEYTGMFFRENGVPVTKCFTDFNELEFAMVTGSKRSRIVIIEEGLGDFVTMAGRGDINNIAGMCDGEDKKIIIFHVSSIIKSDIKGYKYVDFRPFVSTRDVVDTIKDLGEFYLDTEEFIEDKEERVEKALRFQGNFVEDEFEIPTIISNNVQLESILTNGRMRNGNDLESFKVSY